MAFTPMAFDPTDGLKNTTSYPTNPADETAARKQIQDVMDELKAGINSLITELEAAAASASLGAVVGGASGNLQSFIDAVEAAGTGTLPPNGSVTNLMMATDVKIGSLADLDTTNKDSVVDSINEVVSNTGDLTTLSTTEKGSVVGSINEVVSDISTTEGYLVGKIDYFAMSTAPTGYLKANGAAVSRTTYASLFTAIGTTFGVGDGSTTFNLPDLRGVFPRGWDDSRGYDTGRTFGSYQADDNKAHTHTGTSGSVGNHTHTIPGEKVASDMGGSDGEVYTTGRNPSSTTSTSSSGSHTHTFTTDSTGATEVKVKNVALLACIKY